MDNKWGKFFTSLWLDVPAFILLAVFDNGGGNGNEKVTRKVKRKGAKH